MLLRGKSSVQEGHFQYFSKINKTITTKKMPIPPKNSAICVSLKAITITVNIAVMVINTTAVSLHLDNEI